MDGGVDTQGSVLRPQPWAGESQHLQRCCCLCKPLPEPSPRGGSSTSSPIPTLLKPLQGDGATTEAPSQPSPSGRNTNCWPIPAFFKVKEFQLRPHPSLPQGEGALLKCLKHSEMELPPLGEGWGGAKMGLPPLGQGLGGASVGMIPGLLPLAMPLEDYLPMTNSRVPPAMMSA